MTCQLHCVRKRAAALGCSRLQSMAGCCSRLQQQRFTGNLSPAFCWHRWLADGCQDEREGAYRGWKAAGGLPTVNARSSPPVAFCSARSADFLQRGHPPVKSLLASASRRSGLHWTISQTAKMADFCRLLV